MTHAVLNTTKYTDVQYTVSFDVKIRDSYTAEGALIVQYICSIAYYIEVYSIESMLI